MQFRVEIFLETLIEISIFKPLIVYLLHFLSWFQKQSLGGVLKYFPKFIAKHLHQSVNLRKPFLQNTSAQMLLCFVAVCQCVLCFIKCLRRRNDLMMKIKVFFNMFDKQSENKTCLPDHLFHKDCAIMNLVVQLSYLF